MSYMKFPQKNWRKSLVGKINTTREYLYLQDSALAVTYKTCKIVVAYAQIDFESYIVPCDRALAHPALPLQMPILGPLLHYGNATYSIIAMQLCSAGYSCFSQEQEKWLTLKNEQENRIFHFSLCAKPNSRKSLLAEWPPLLLVLRLTWIMGGRICGKNVY